jgi:trk system potassium uptake protein TrkH
MLTLNNNKRFFLKIFSTAMVVFGLSMLLPCFVAVIFDEGPAILPLGLGCALCSISGFMMKHFIRLEASNVLPRMNYLATMLIWLIIIAITSVIIFAGQAEHTLIDSFFAATASLTTTGAGNIDVSVYPHSFQLWRSILNWFGGIGIILIAASCLSRWEFSGNSLISVEVPGPEFLKSTVAYKGTYKKSCF